MHLFNIFLITMGILVVLLLLAIYARSTHRRLMTINLQSIAALLLCVLLPPAASAQELPNNPVPRESLAWSRVQNLANGEQITVARPGGEPIPCVFTGATDDELFCNAFYRGREFHFDRAEIERVRMDDKYRNTRILLGAFTVGGLIWGVATPPNNGTPRALDGLAGAAVGALAGLVVSFPIALLVPGRTVFHRSASSRNAHSLDPDPQASQSDLQQSNAPK